MCIVWSRHCALRGPIVSSISEQKQSVANASSYIKNTGTPYTTIAAPFKYLK